MLISILSMFTVYVNDNYGKIMDTFGASNTF